jgi:hypothetical protein
MPVYIICFHCLVVAHLILVSVLYKFVETSYRALKRQCYTAKRSPPLRAKSILFIEVAPIPVDMNDQTGPAFGLRDHIEGWFAHSPTEGNSNVEGGSPARCAA